MSAESVVIVGIGMMTAVGLTSAETAASVRSGAARFSESPLADKHFIPLTLAEVPADGLPPLSDKVAAPNRLTAREQRLLRLATLPLIECLAPLTGVPGSVALCLALPETETTMPLDRGAFLARLAAQVGNRVDVQGSDATHRGRAGGLAAVGQAVLTLQSGQSDFAVAGGIDTYRDPYVLATLDMEQRVKSDANSDGFIPGEGAAFLLLTTARAAQSRDLAPLATVSAVAAGFETGHLYSPEPYRGDGLAAVVSQLVAARAIDAPIRDVYASMNGENHWAKEWGVAYLRNRAAFHPNHGVHHPADCFGDTGAACGPIMVGLVALGLRGGYRRTPALVYASSDRGPRAAVVVSAEIH